MHLHNCQRLQRSASSWSVLAFVRQTNHAAVPEHPVSYQYIHSTPRMKSKNGASVCWRNVVAYVMPLSVTSGRRVNPRVIFSTTVVNFDACARSLLTYVSQYYVVILLRSHRGNRMTWRNKRGSL